MKSMMVYGLSLFVVFFSGCSSTLPDIPVKIYSSVKSCSNTTFSLKEWKKKQKLTYIKNHTGKESFKDLVVDRYGNSYLLELNKYGSKTRIVKYNCRWERVWVKDMLKENSISIKALAIQSDFLYTVGNGQVLSPSTHGSSLVTGYRYIAKYDLDGRRVWFTKETKKNRIENGNLYLRDVAVNSMGEAYVVGYQNISECGYIDKYSSDGVLLWHKTFPNLKFSSIHIDQHQDLIVVGETSHDALVSKYDKEGNQLWKRLLSLKKYPQVHLFLDVVSDSHENIYTLGHNYIQVTELFKFSPKGKLLWSKKTDIGARGYDVGASLLLGADNRLYISGQGLQRKNNNFKFLATAVYDLDGKLLMSRLYKDADKQNVDDALLINTNFYKVYKRKDGRYYIIQKSKVVYDDLKYFKVLHEDSNGTAIQMIDSHNRAKKIFIVADELQHPMDYIPLMCGNGVITHHVSVVDKSKMLDVEVVFHETDEEQYQKDVNRTHSVVRISKSKADKVFFEEHKKQITFSENYDNSKPMLYYQKGIKYGFLGSIVVKRTKKSVKYSLKKSKDKKLYDALVFEEDSKIRLHYHGLWGYRNISKIKYKSIEKFDENLARFILPNGKKGYLDLKGVEYYD